MDQFSIPLRIKIGGGAATGATGNGITGVGCSGIGRTGGPGCGAWNRFLKLKKGCENGKIALDEIFSFKLDF